MSFAGETKGELCRTALNRKCCTQAEAYGVLLYCNTFTAREVRVITESDSFSRRLPQLLERAFRGQNLAAFQKEFEKRKG